MRGLSLNQIFKYIRALRKDFMRPIKYKKVQILQTLCNGIGVCGAGGLVMPKNCCFIFSFSDFV